MAKREKYSAILRCAKCGAEGTGEFEENETPPHHDGKFERVIISLPHGFKSSGDVDAPVKCQRCGNTVLI